MKYKVVIVRDCFLQIGQIVQDLLSLSSLDFS